MGEIVNLRAARKRKARDEKAATASANRALFGRTKSEKALDRATAKKTKAFVDGHKRLPSKP